MKLLHEKNTAWYDWRDEGAYPSGENASVEQWAWEFLRRSPLYIEDWNTYIAEFIRRKWGRELSAAEMRDAKFKERFEFFQMILSFDSDKELDVYLPPLVNGEKEEDWKDRVGPEGQKLPLHRAYGHKWGLLLMIDPADPKGFWHFGTRPLIRLKTTMGAKELASGSIGVFEPLTSHVQCKVDVTFNLEVSLEGQLRFLREVLEQEQRNLINQNILAAAVDVRVRTDKYRNHLRLLDAYAIGIGVREAGEVLYPYSSDGVDYDDGRTKRVRAQLKAAEEFRDGGYRQLLGEDWRAAGKGKNSD